MQTLIEMVRDTAALSAMSSVLYACTITVTTLTATLSRDPQRRLDARRVLKILLHRRDNGDQG